MSQTNLASLLIEDETEIETTLVSANKLVKHRVNVHKFGDSSLASLNDNCTPELITNIHFEITKKARQIGLVVAGLGNIGQRLALKNTQVKIKGFIS